MKKGKRILAMAGVIILAGMYVVTLISAVFATSATIDLFKASLLATLVMPILIYVYLLIYRLITGKGDEVEEEDSKRGRNFEDGFSDKTGKIP